VRLGLGVEVGGSFLFCRFVLWFGVLWERGVRKEGSEGGRAEGI
jgi:hypothetical protein